MSEAQTPPQDSLCVQSEEGRSGFVLLFSFPSSQSCLSRTGCISKIQAVDKGINWKWNLAPVRNINSRTAQFHVMNIIKVMSQCHTHCNDLFIWLVFYTPATPHRLLLYSTLLRNTGEGQNPGIEPWLMLYFLFPVQNHISRDQIWLDAIRCKQL